MNAPEAKDFLVQQTVEQAAREHVLFSDPERRMMYFTESGDCPEDPIALNDAFEAQYDTEEYELKVGKLMRHAYQRIKKENPESLHQWEKAIGELSKGDHYILVLCPSESAPRSRSNFSQSYTLKLIGGMAASLIALYFVLPAVFGRYGFHWRHTSAPTTAQPVPIWAQWAIIAFLIAGYIYVAVVPWISKLYRRKRSLPPE